MKKIITSSIIIATIAAMTLISCKTPGSIERPELLKIRTHHNEIYLTGISGQGLSSLSYSLRQSRDKDMIAFLINNKRILDPSFLNDPNFGIEKCQFLKEENLVVGAACILDLSKLDSASPNGVERKVISYFNSKNEALIRKRIAWNNFSPSYIIIEKSGPFLRIDSDRVFFIKNEETLFSKKHYIIEPIAGKVKKNQLFSIGVNSGNKLSASKIDWEKQAATMKKSGLSCTIKQGLDGSVLCKIINARKLKNKPALLHLTADRHGQKAFYSVEVRGARFKDKKQNTDPAAKKTALTSQAFR